MLDVITYNTSTIHFGPIEKSVFQDVLAKEFSGSKKVIITDEQIHDIWIEDLITNFEELSNAEIIQIPTGEVHKTLDICVQIWSALSEYEIGRGDLIINFGGGVITDLGGFVASLFKRGMKFINIPTTLLAQVDASIGGKTGVDLGPYKNQIGVFADAAHVFIDEKYIESLSENQIKSGFAEMLKHGLIADADYWARLKDFDPKDVTDRLLLIRHSVGLKRDVVERDHQESGLRKILNFGHTIGHGIEGYFLEQNKPLLHGYAVATGMKAEAFISKELGMLSESELQDIVETIDRIYPAPMLTPNDYKPIVQLMHNDKKNKGGVIQFSLLEGVGNCVFDQEVNDKLILEALKFIS
ncbi:3-dehydroquinate synthase [Paracrocinitomix mangrovi]|uniref:3-dehydroquinate synthase n=1 Tax=Paracrocinitomix mangrovi TaxID=2862509 RepID=UPI001C8E2339|nr:3-dehydroquinate synthase [Paracrocinitomix mangrovi]UKN01423.1 3-dehydroquinate synthase [Paracrocinitomix mangrovi]